MDDHFALPYLDELRSSINPNALWVRNPTDNSCYCHLIREGSLLQGRENGAATTRVNGRLRSTELGRHDKTLRKGRGGASMCICTHNYSIKEV